MNCNCSFFVRRFNQAKDLAGIFVEPVAQILGSVLVLRVQIRLMSMGYGIGSKPFDMLVGIHVKWHCCSPFWSKVIELEWGNELCTDEPDESGQPGADCRAMCPRG